MRISWFVSTSSIKIYWTKPFYFWSKISIVSEPYLIKHAEIDFTAYGLHRDLAQTLELIYVFFLIFLFQILALTTTSTENSFLAFPASFSTWHRYLPASASVIGLIFSRWPPRVKKRRFERLTGASSLNQRIRGDGFPRITSHSENSR